jgi:hypothetical protein
LPRLPQVTADPERELVGEITEQGFAQDLFLP